MSNWPFLWKESSGIFKHYSNIKQVTQNEGHFFIEKGKKTPQRNSFSCLDNEKSCIENKRHKAFKGTIMLASWASELYHILAWHYLEKNASVIIDILGCEPLHLNFKVTWASRGNSLWSSSATLFQFQVLWTSSSLLKCKAVFCSSP